MRGGQWRARRGAPPSRRGAYPHPAPAASAQHPTRVFLWFVGGTRATNGNAHVRPRVARAWHCSLFVERAAPRRGRAAGCNADIGVAWRASWSSALHSAPFDNRSIGAVIACIYHGVDASSWIFLYSPRYFRERHEFERVSKYFALCGPVRTVALFCSSLSKQIYWIGTGVALRTDRNVEAIATALFWSFVLRPAPFDSRLSRWYLSWSTRPLGFSYILWNIFVKNTFEHVLNILRSVVQLMFFCSTFPK